MKPRFAGLLVRLGVPPEVIRLRETLAELEARLEAVERRAPYPMQRAAERGTLAQRIRIAHIEQTDASQFSAPRVLP